MDVLIVGFALFSLFFGAGNLIFPPLLGKTFESNWIVASFGFVLTGVGLASLAVISMAKKEGDIKKFTKVGGEKLGYAVTLLIALILGPLGAIPRTGATSAEVIIASGLNIPYYLFVIIFFSLSLYVILSGSNVIDLIGRYLTPMLLLVLAIMIIGGIINPIGPIQKSTFTSTDTLTQSIIEGYNTMDALSAIAFAPIIIKSLKDKGNTDDLIKKSIQVTLIAALGLAVVYFSLTYLGASSSIIHRDASSRVRLLVAIASSTLGHFGKYILAAIIVLACFTTSVGLITSISDMLVKISSDKFNYKTLAVVTAILSLILSMAGVDEIVKLTSPLLSFTYPIVLAMICFNLFDRDIGEKYRLLTFYIVGFIALIQTLVAYVSMVNLEAGLTFSRVISWLPFYKVGFPWLMPFVLVFILVILATRNDKNKVTP